MNKRPAPDQLEQEHPGLMEAGTLALVFEERVMPRAATGDGADAAAAAAAGTSDKGAIVCGDGGGAAEADPESDGGPEHLVSFEALMSWPDVQVLCYLV